MEILISLAVASYFITGVALVVLMGARHPLAYVLWPFFWPFILFVMVRNWNKNVL